MSRGTAGLSTRASGSARWRDRSSPPPEPHGPLVTFARARINARFGDEGSMLKLAKACDIPTRWSCRTGVCHTCESRLLDGGISYAPEPVDPPAEGNVLVCCAEPTEDVVLDL